MFRLRCYVIDCLPKTERYELNIKIDFSRTFPVGYTDKHTAEK